MDDGSNDRIMPPGQFDLTDDNYVDPRIQGLETSLQPFAERISSQRGTMFASHLQQHLELIHAEMPIIATGKEVHFGDYDFNSFGGREMIIEAVIPKFRGNPQMIKDAPTYTIIFRDLTDPNNQVLDCYELSAYTTCACGFGYKNQILNPRLLRVGARIDKNTPIVVSSAHDGYTQDDNGILRDGAMYKMGVNANVAYATHPAATTDAVVVSTRLRDKMSHIATESVSAEIKQDDILLNIYGTYPDYFSIPNIGDCINSNGILLAIRSYSDDALFDMTPSALQKPNWESSDRLYYGHPGAKVIDIQVYTRYSQIAKCRRDHNLVFEQLFQYQDMHFVYYQEIVNVYNRLKETELPLSPRFNQLVTRCMEMIKTKMTFNGYKLMNRKEKEPIDFMTVKITYAWERRMSIGFKTTGRDGAKGVNTCCLPLEDMYTDDFGYIADIIISFESVLNRMNVGQLYEQCLGRGCMMITDRVRNGEYGSDAQHIFDVLIDFARDIRPLYAELLLAVFTTPEKREAFVEAVKQEGMRLIISSFSIKDMEKVVMTLYEKWKIVKTPVKVTTYEGDKKVVYRSEFPMLIGPKYLYLLGKQPHYQLISTEFGFVSQFELPIKLSNDLKKQSPYSRTPLRLGEDEYAILSMMIGPLNAARIMGLYASCIEAIEMTQEALLNSDNPVNVYDIPMSTSDIIGKSKAVTMCSHMFGVSGIGIPIRSAWDKYVNFRQQQGREDLI